jgi:hypothetical protein
VPAYAASASALIAVLTTMVAQTEVLAGQVEQGFGRHPDVEIYRSQPGLGVILGARVLAEFGDDPDRYTDAKARKNYSGISPITKASGTKRVVGILHGCLCSHSCYDEHRAWHTQDDQAAAASTREPRTAGFVLPSQPAGAQPRSTRGSKPTLHAEALHCGGHRHTIQPGGIPPLTHPIVGCLARSFGQRVAQAPVTSETSGQGPENPAPWPSSARRCRRRCCRAARP